jgi:hypothetical protein
MASSDKPGKKTAIRLLEEDIEKGISEKRVQNLVLKKILDAVGAEKDAGSSGQSSKSKKNSPNK